MTFALSVDLFCKRPRWGFLLTYFNKVTCVKGPSQRRYIFFKFQNGVCRLNYNFLFFVPQDSHIHSLLVSGFLCYFECVLSIRTSRFGGLKGGGNRVLPFPSTSVAPQCLSLAHSRCPGNGYGLTQCPRETCTQEAIT